MSALQRQTYANTVDPLFVKTNGNSVVEGTVTADSFVTQGGVGTQGIRLKNEQYISFTDEPATPVVEGLRIYSAATGGPPDQTFAQIEIPSTSTGLFFSQIGQAANSFIRPSAFGAGADTLSIGGTVSTNRLTLGAQSCGTGSIAIGATNVVINSTAVTATSKIFLSHTGSPSAGPGAGAPQGNLTVNGTLIVPGTSFRVDLTDIDGISIAASNAAATFNWLIIG